MVDERDFQVLAGLLKEPLAGNEALGRSVGLSGTAVKARLQRLADEGVFGGLHGIPASELFHRRRQVYVFQGERVSKDAAQRAIRIDPVVSAQLRQDGRLGTVLYAVSDASDGPPDDLVHAFGEPFFSVTPRRFQPPPSNTVLSPIDWRVMRPLAATRAFRSERLRLARDSRRRPSAATAMRCSEMAR